jgi:two-component system OmpR family sensor kinase
VLSVLVVDDDPPIRRMLERTLSAEGYSVRTSPDGGRALAAVERSVPDLLVLDVAMPGMDGLAVCRRLRRRGLALPILLLTARDAVPDRVAGLDAGADDYLVKPFASEELLARARALLRRGSEPGEVLGFGDLVLDVTSRSVRRGEHEIHLSAREAQLLELFLRNPRQVISRTLALERVWGSEAAATLNAVDRCVSYLRNKLGDPPLIQTVRGVGFTLRSTMAALVSVLVALVIVGVGVDVLVGRHLRGSLDRALRQRAVAVAQLSATAPALLVSPGALDAPAGGTQVLTQVLDRRGRIVARSLALGGRVLPVEAMARSVIASGQGRYLDARLGSESMRVYVAPLALAGGAASGGAVVVAASTHDLGETLGRMHLVVLLAALVASGAAAVTLVLLMRRAIAPLRRLTRAAAEIESTGDPRLRLPQPAASDEVGRLAATLNGMLTALERAREAERRFLADASHELRTPLTALVGNIDYLARHGPSEELVAELQHDTQRLARLADDLLALSREEAASPPEEVVKLDELAREADAADIDVVAGPASVRGDRGALERALSNLLENAHRHGRGRITIETRTHGELALLTVADEGPGLTGEHAKLAFGRFWRGQSGSGSGLGLAIVKATAQRHGGRAYAEGSRFTIELPAVRDLSESRSTSEGEELEKGSR